MAKKGNAGGASGASNKRRWIKWIFLGPILAFILLQLYFFVQVCWFVWFNPGSTSFMRQQLSELREKNPNAELKHQWVPYDPFRIT